MIGRHRRFWIGALVLSLAMPAAAPQPVVPVPAPAAGVQPSSAPEPAADAAPATGLRELNSPMVGTFYRAPSPDAEAFAKTGDQVRAGDVLCIVGDEAISALADLPLRLAEGDYRLDEHDRPVLVWRRWR